MSSVIPKQPKKEREQITIKLDRDVLQNLEHYCRYLESSRDYVINQSLAFIFRKDRQFAEWSESQGLSTSPPPNGKPVQNGPTKREDRKPTSPAVQGRLSMPE